MKKLFVMGMAALLLVAFAVPAMADVKIGGIVFTDFYYLDRDKENAAFRGLGDGSTSYNVTGIQVPNITRLYARWTNEDNVGLYIEFGVGQDGGNLDGSSSNGAGLRHAYGWWDVNPMFQIMAGKSTTPFSPLNPSQLLGTRSGSVNIIGVGYGDYYAGRFAQVRGTFKFGKAARLEIALVDPNGTMAGGTFNTYNAWPVGPWFDYSANNTVIPRIDIGVPIYLGPIHLYPGFLWQDRKVDKPVGLDGGPVDDSVTTWIGSIGVKMGFGPFGFAGEFNYGENWGNTRGLAGVTPASLLAFASLKSDNNIEDAETYSFWVDFSYKLGPVTPHFIYGQMKTKNKFDTLDMEAKTQMIGFSVPIDLAKGFRVRPEVMWYDDGDLDVSGHGSADFGKYAIYGVQFQITF
ncbi:MAG: porin [Deltaproteobacteria bacterium]|nr:porin [Deltaproteobacteria bacterium]